MAGITQTIPNYQGGMSQQPDQMKFQGQVKNIINAIPDITHGLYKRPGSFRSGPAKLINVQSGGSWFHYHRDEAEGSYVGQIAADGSIRVWKASGDNPGTEQNVTYGTGGETAIKSYLAATNSEDIQSLTINDTTFLNNRTKTVSTTGTTSGYPDTHFAFIELLRTENGRQYSLNVYNTENTSTLNTCTRLKIDSDTLDEGGGTGHCPGIVNQVFAVSNQVNSTTVTSAGGGVGTGYNTAGEITLTGGGGTGAKLEGIEVGGEITGLNILDGGTGYTSAPTIKIGKDWTTGEYLNGSYFQRHNDGKLYTSGTGLNTTCGSTAPTHTSGTVSDGNIDWTYAGTRATATCTVQSGKENLIWKQVTLGQQGRAPGSTTGTPASADYACSYNRQLTLLHGGEGWTTGDTAIVQADQAQTAYSYTVKVEDHEAAVIKADIKAVRPTPTPFDADTAVTVDAILAGIQSELDGTGITASQIGSGIYLSSSSAFQVEVVDQDLMRVMQKQVNDVTKLPQQCKDGYIVQITNTRMSDEDDYWVRFEGTNGKDGPGSWVECAAPGIVKSFDASTMPHVIQRTALAHGGTSNEIATFTVKQFEYADRICGDDITNQAPSFVGTKNTADPPVYSQDVTINKVLFFRNRIAFLTGSHVILSKPDTAAKPDFWAATAMTVSAVDPIDIQCSSTYPSDLYDGIEVTTGLLCFSTNQQFLLSSDDTVLNPDTAKLRSVSAFNYNEVIPPLSLGKTIGWVDNSGKYSKFIESADILREGEPTVSDTSKLVPTLLPKGLDLFTNSKENNLVFFGKTGTNDVFGYRYWNTNEGRQQSAWFKWKFRNNLKYQFCINDTYFYLDTDDFLQSINLVQATADPSIDQDNVNYLLHLDNYTTISGGRYDAATNLTTFTHDDNGCRFDWYTDVSTGTGSKLVLIDTDTTTSRLGRYAEVTVTGTSPPTFTVPGIWHQATLYIGYLYDYQIDFPRIYSVRQQGNTQMSDINSSLVVHRVKFNFGKVGLYETTLTRVGKSDYTEVYESTDLDEYDASDAPYMEEKIQTVPVYERNKNVDITLKSAHPAPATLHSMSWEGDFSPRSYRRV